MRVYIVLKHEAQPDFMDGHGEEALDTTEIVCVQSSYDVAEQWANNLQGYDSENALIIYEVQSWIVE